MPPVGYLDILLGAKKHLVLVQVPWEALSQNVDCQGLNLATELLRQHYLRVSKANVLGVAMGNAISKHRLPGTL
jgi:hypothetical protein